MTVANVTTDRFQLAQAYRETAQTGTLAKFWKRRWSRAAEMAGWLDQNQLPSLTEKQALALYRASGGSKIREYAGNPLPEIFDTLDFLLYDTITLEARFNECVAEDGAYKLAGAGKEFASHMLCLRQPGLLGVWNYSAERALRRLGRYPKGLSKGHYGLRYMDLLEAIQRLRPEFGLADFREVDEFCFLVSRGISAAGLSAVNSETAMAEGSEKGER